MWNRAAIKENGKANMKKNYWNSVLVAVIYSLFVGGAGATFSRNFSSGDQESNIDWSNPDAAAIALLILGALGIGFTIGLIVKIVLLNPLNVGCSRFFVVNQSEQAMVNELGYAFKQNFGQSLLAMLLSQLAIGLGFCLFIIPGIILSYSYRMVPYILAQEPHVGVVETLQRSRAMMRGNKWNAFVFDLSFIGWHLLAVLTCGILEIFYVAPYFQNANAGLYIAIRDLFDGGQGQNNVVGTQTQQ